ncbi:mechanosensitive ion channel [Mesorhizobium sp. M7A.F.Ca.US.001.04.1.1]|uniref:mechanosensitive ion channel family protein n=1 Tax=unclassified Mesorhizobium TaxID=325217 RepID=UPI000FCB9DA5|nr:MULTISPECIES: mechanosensitive ion channel family protein [unclassified Mesorhizobium]RUY27060.1 mechanosensitive ion channel [Mesorhizobium sp. M7A.F.Ca.US.001.04.2.1]RUY44045.1 mechanosensitive ion channel [Mesorhizobium sp. M7A.F.Ca.US.001.04.1.1]
MVDLGPAMNLWNSPLIYIVSLGLAGIVVWNLVPARFANARLIVQLVFFLAMSIMVLELRVVPYEPARGDETTSGAILIGLVKLLWWVHLAWALIGFVRIYVVFERKPHEARLLQDVVVGVVYTGMLLSILAFVFAVPVGTLIATSGVFAVMLGLALQNTLGDVFSGIALNLGRPYVLGNWIILNDGTEGRVVETNWRSTQLLTPAHNVIALPNSLVAKIGVTNLSGPDESHGLAVTVKMSLTKTPAIIVDTMRMVLLSCTSILQDPSPVVAITSLDAAAIEIELSFRVASLDQRITARNEIFDLVYRHSRSVGVLLAAPLSASIAVTSPPIDGTATYQGFAAIDLINAIPIFSALTDAEQEALAAAISVRSYRKGDVIAEQGEMLPSLMIVRKGVIVRQHGQGNASMKEVGRLAPGDFFGETGLLAGIGETSTLRAMTHVEVYEIDQESFAPLLLDRPEMAEDLAATLSRGTSAYGETGIPGGQQHESSKFALLKAIQAVFHTAPSEHVRARGRPGIRKDRDS